MTNTEGVLFDRKKWAQSLLQRRRRRRRRRILRAGRNAFSENSSSFCFFSGEMLFIDVALKPSHAVFTYMCLTRHADTHACRIRCMLLQVQSGEVERCGRNGLYVEPFYDWCTVNCIGCIVRAISMRIYRCGCKVSALSTILMYSIWYRAEWNQQFLNCRFKNRRFVPYDATWNRVQPFTATNKLTLTNAGHEVFPRFGKMTRLEIWSCTPPSHEVFAFVFCFLSFRVQKCDSR